MDYSVLTKTQKGAFIFSLMASKASSSSKTMSQANPEVCGLRTVFAAQSVFETRAFCCFRL